jgi:hypothetical protein
MTHNISRRTFVGTSAALSAATLLPFQSLHGATKLYGDGVHDDTDALQALFDGRSVQPMKAGLVARHENGTVMLLNGSFRVREPIQVKASTNLYSGHCSFRLQDGPASPHPFLTCVD